MPILPADFHAAVIDAGAVLAGFCGTFLSFRIQREASYYRQPIVDFAADRGKDVYLGLSHFTPAFLLLGAATLTSLVFGVALPLLVLAEVRWAPADPRLVVGGLLAVVVLLAGYFFAELVHYEILKKPLVQERRKTRPIVVVTLTLAVIVFVVLLL